MRRSRKKGPMSVIGPFAISFLLFYALGQSSEPILPIAVFAVFFLFGGIFNLAELSNETTRAKNKASATRKQNAVKTSPTKDGAQIAGFCTAYTTGSKMQIGTNESSNLVGNLSNSSMPEHTEPILSNSIPGKRTEEVHRNSKRENKSKPNEWNCETLPIALSLAVQHSGRTFVINDAILLGRDESCQLSYREGTPGISRKHCVLTWDDDQSVFILMDLDSTFGTYLEDGTKLVPRTPYRLQPGERFYLAGKENMILVDLDRPESEAAGGIPMRSGETSVHYQKADRKKTGGAARVIGWILIIFQIIALWGASQTGGLQLGLFEALGYFLPGILGIILICVGDRRKRKADQQSENR